ncbi:N-acetylmuramoyl-L-alanine amidase [Phytohalomonas tamaricis]|uniref:N-acetylmuramoyl-L-alanine amidase n=1 Tax=Phytohalomonas tamaricis TaxID=2081032 RepID=UPI000D0B9AE6|nr:N-acetylmuramoyl-L-alanine amidase [Phytohalomonas tamaricis]
MKFPVLLWLFGLVALLSVAMPAQSAELSGLRIWSAEDNTRLVFDLDASVHSNVFTLDNPSRLVVDLDDTHLKTNLSHAADGDSTVKAVRSGIRQGNDLRIVLDLARPVTPSDFTLPPSGDSGHRLVIDLKHTGGGRSSGAAKDKSSTAAKDGGGDPIEAMIQAQEKEARAKLAGSNPKDDPKVREAIEQETTPASRQLAKAHPKRDIIVVIDPGHGGKDPGATGPGRTREKDVVLQIGKRLKAKFDAAPGFKAYLTRSDDRFIPLRERTRIARRHHADFFVSIHADAVRSGSPRGTSVYALSQHGATSETARWLAQSENNADLIGGVDGDLSLDDKDEMLRGVLLDLSMTATVNDSLSAGSDVLGYVSRFNTLHRSKVEQAGFVVLKSPDIPSLLVETGFISNPTEERLLKTASHQEKLANAVYQGIRQHFLQSPPPTSLLAWQRDQARGGGADEYRVRSGDTLSVIALNNGVSLSALRKANNLDSDVVRVGQVLVIP